MGMRTKSWLASDIGLWSLQNRDYPPGRAPSLESSDLEFHIGTYAPTWNEPYKAAATVVLHDDQERWQGIYLDQGELDEMILDLFSAASIKVKVSLMKAFLDEVLAKQ